MVYFHHNVLLYYLHLEFLKLCKDLQMLNIDALKFDEKGLIPAIVVDAVSKKVLTLAYMNRESLKITMEKNIIRAVLPLIV